MSAGLVYPPYSTRAKIAGVWGMLSGVKIVPRLPEEERMVGDEELQWQPNLRLYIAGPVAWRVFTQLRELKIKEPT